MRSAATTADDFLSEQPENVRQDLAQLRTIIRNEMPEALEGGHLVVISNEVVHSGFLGKNGRYHTFRSVREESPSEASS